MLLRNMFDHDLNEFNDLGLSPSGYPNVVLAGNCLGFKESIWRLYPLANQRGTGENHQFKGTSIAVLAYWRVPIILSTLGLYIFHL